MSKREKIIVLVMALVVFYGVYTLFFSGPKKSVGSATGGRADELNKMITDLAVGLSKEGPTEVDKYIAATAEGPWEKDPLFKEKISLSKDGVAVQAASGKKADRAVVVVPDFSFTYSGYLEMAGVKIAIINGMEYEIGDDIIGGPYILRDINPSKVVIGVKGVEGKEGEISVPIEEEIL